MPKGRIAHGEHKGERGYDPKQHRQYWDTAWRTLTSAVRCPKCATLQRPTEKCPNKECGGDMKGIKGATEALRFHDLLHTFITHMVERGIPLEVIQTFVGHMSARMVRPTRTYRAAQPARQLNYWTPILATTDLGKMQAIGGTQ